MSGPTMLYEVYQRICVGLPLEADAVAGLVAGFHRSLSLPDDARLEAVHEALRFDLARHETNTPDRELYERAFEAYVDQLWDVDCAIGGLTDGGVDPPRGWVFLGVRVETLEPEVGHDAMPALAGRPRWLKKGDLTTGSDLARQLGPRHAKTFNHAARAYARASKMIVGDAHKRLAPLRVVRGHDPDWALLRWLVALPGR
jgi:hypothetical protein